MRSSAVSGRLVVGVFSSMRVAFVLVSLFSFLEKDVVTILLCCAPIKVKYDYIHKYCKICKLHGHKEDECITLNPELAPKRRGINKENTEDVLEMTNALNKVTQLHNDKSRN